MDEMYATNAEDVRPGGLFLYDLRKLSAEPVTPEALIAERITAPGPQEGCLDVAFCQEGTETLAVTLMDGVVSAFPLSAAGPNLEAEWSFDVVERWEAQGQKASAIASSGRYVFAATTAPSLGVWRRTQASKSYGHSEYRRPQPLPPLTPVLRLAPLSQSQVEVGSAQGAVLDMVQDALECDRQRLQKLVPTNNLGAGEKFAGGSLQMKSRLTTSNADADLVKASSYANSSGGF
jgi:hypothetical protein